MIDEKLLMEEIAKRGVAFTEEQMDLLEYLIEKQPKLDADINVGSKWIPIGQYPSEPSLLCFENGEMVVGYYDYDAEEWNVQCSSEYFSCLDIGDDEPIAYMPLPQAYKGE